MPLHRVVVLVKGVLEVVQAWVDLVLEALVKVPEDIVKEVL
jgi:hypothetical protein